jgi:hypothetical protein
MRQVTTEQLYRFLREHNVMDYVLSQYMGVSESIVRGCFKHDLNRHGKPLQFSADNILKMNDALPRLAADIRACELHFGQGETFTNRCGREYERSIAQQVKDGMMRFFSVKDFASRVLGWNVLKCKARLCSTGSVTYSNVERQDCERLNDELIAIASVLESYKVVADKTE